jgi:dienelactone hydrolase
MQTLATIGPLGASPIAELGRPHRPSWRRVVAILISAAVLLGVSTVASTMAYLRVPDPTGAMAVGKRAAIWPSGEGSRSIRVVAWYPADPATGTEGRYLADLATIDDALVESGEVGAFEVAGIGLVRDPARIGAAIAGPADEQFPVIILSPGNATNVEFYAAIAEDLASHGFVVVGIDHPGQVAAVALGSEVVTYAGDAPLSEATTESPRRIDERVVDIGAVLDQLAGDAPGLEAIAARADLARVGVMGHSNGGVAAAMACRDSRVAACLNIDGQSGGGPFDVRPNPIAPTKPFLYLTKETDLHPALAEVFEAGGAGTFRVIVPAAAHDQFGDTASYRPRVLPVAGVADDVGTVSRGFSVAFFDHALRGAPRSVFAHLPAPTDVEVFVYPLTR